MSIRRTLIVLAALVTVTVAAVIVGVGGAPTTQGASTGGALSPRQSNDLFQPPIDHNPPSGADGHRRELEVVRSEPAPPQDEAAPQEEPTVSYFQLELSQYAGVSYSVDLPNARAAVADEALNPHRKKLGDADLLALKAIIDSENAAIRESRRLYHEELSSYGREQALAGLGRDALPGIRAKPGNTLHIEALPDGRQIAVEFNAGTLPQYQALILERKAQKKAAEERVRAFFEEL